MQKLDPTTADLDMLHALEESGKDIMVMLNKIAKIKNSHLHTHLKKLVAQLQGHKVFLYSSITKAGKSELLAELLA